jgi:methanogenic corrinoid protein MtbC1
VNQPNPFLAELLTRSASGYAGYAAGILIEQARTIDKRYGQEAFLSWRKHLTQRVIELSAAVAAGEPKLFVARLMWSKKLFIARHQDVAELEVSLIALSSVLNERLPDIARHDSAEYIDLALRALRENNPEIDVSELNPASPNDRIALEYLQTILEGNIGAAIALVTATNKIGLDPTGVYREVLLPAQREIGRLWHLGDINVAEEHLVTSTTQRCMAILANETNNAPAIGKTVVAAAVAGNVHDVGLRAVTDLFQMAGWRSIFLGADVPIRDLPATLTFFESDLLLLTATLSTQTPKVAETIRIIRDRCERDVKILLGGGAFDEAPLLAERLGADGYAATIDEAVSTGSKLLGLDVH